MKKDAYRVILNTPILEILRSNNEYDNLKYTLLSPGNNKKLARYKTEL